MEQSLSLFLVASVALGLGVILGQVRTKKPSLDASRPAMGFDARTDREIREDQARADRDANPRTVMHFLIRQGFYPMDEDHAEDLMLAMVAENERLRDADREFNN